MPVSRALADQPTNAELVKRLLLLSWTYRRGCAEVLAYQVVLLAMGLGGLGLTGLAIDITRHALSPSARPPRWPFGLSPPSSLAPFTLIAAIGAAVLAMAAVRAVLNYFYAVAVGRLVQWEIVPALRAEVYDRLQRLGFRFFDANASGSLINRVTGDVQSVRAFVDGVLIQSLIMVLSLAVYLVYMLSKHVGLTWVSLLGTPLLWVVTTRFSRRVRPQYSESRELVDEMVLALTEGVQGIQVTKGFGRETEEYAKFAAKNRAVLEQQQNIFDRVSRFSPTINLLSQSSVVVLLFYGGNLLATGALTLGDLIVFAGLLQQFSGQVSNMANIVNTVQQSLIAARRVYEVLDAPIEIVSPPDAVKPANVRGAVRFDRVSFGYASGSLALRDVDFEVKPGQCVAILGATGAGKSTLLSLIPRFYDPEKGRVLVDGIDVRRYDVSHLRRQIGVVFQESFLFSNTVAANIAFGHPDATREQIERAAKMAAAHDFILDLPSGYDSVLSESGGDLSGGQRQRLAIARAILLDPPLLLLDDPTASIDPETEHEILEAMDQAIRGRTTFVVAHRLSTLRRADFIVVLDDGRIVEQGSHAELMRAGGKYVEAARLQAATGDSPRITVEAKT